MLEKLSLNLKQSFEKADKGNTMFDQIEFEYLNERVQIWDWAMQKILHEGTFIGVNNFGHCRL